MTERLVRRCDCNACDRPLPKKPYGGGAGAYCSQMCADHAGGERWRAEQEHQEA